MTTDEEFLKLALECGASLEGDGFPVNFAHERFLTFCREIERRTFEKAADVCDGEASIEGIAQKCAIAIRAMIKEKE